MGEKGIEVKAKTKKRKAKAPATVNLVKGLQVFSGHLAVSKMTLDDRRVASWLINEVADRMIALVNLTSKQNQMINELESMLRKAAK